jgi:hypothetical protein
MIWARERQRKNGDVVIFTEYDFLPDYEQFGVVPDEPIVCAEYVYGVGGKDPKPQGFPGAWYIQLDKRLVGDLDFSPGGPFHDPAYGLPATLLPGVGQYPEYPGAAYSVGEHLFWQRHLHDPPDMVVGEEKMNVGWMQKRHDRRVSAWIKGAPQEFRRIYGRIESEKCET